MTKAAVGAVAVVVVEIEAAVVEVWLAKSASAELAEVLPAAACLAGSAALLDIPAAAIADTAREIASSLAAAAAVAAEQRGIEQSVDQRCLLRSYSEQPTAAVEVAVA